MAKYSTLAQIFDRFSDEVVGMCKQPALYREDDLSSVSNMRGLKLNKMTRKINNKTTKVAQRMLRLHLDSKRMLDGTKITWR